MKLYYNYKSKNNILYTLDAIVVETKDGAEYSFSSEGDQDLDRELLGGRVKGDVFLNWKFYIDKHGNEQNEELNDKLDREELINIAKETFRKIKDDIKEVRMVFHGDKFFSEDNSLSDEEFNHLIQTDIITDCTCELEIYNESTGKIEEYSFNPSIDDATYII